MPNFTDNSRADNASWPNISIMLCRMVLFIFFKKKFTRNQSRINASKDKSLCFFFWFNLKVLTSQFFRSYRLFIPALRNSRYHMFRSSQCPVGLHRLYAQNTFARYNVKNSQKFYMDSQRELTKFLLISKYLNRTEES